MAANVRGLTLAITIAFFATSLGVGYWSLLESDALSSDPFNPRLVAAQQGRPRGAIVDHANGLLARSLETGGGFRRGYADRSLAQVVGYASSRFGLSGVEAAYADALIGRDASNPVALWRARYLGQREAAGAIVLGIDANVQKAATDSLAGRRGGIVALDPRTGAILASVSLPNFDANQIADPSRQDVAWRQVNGDPERPLLNRVTQGLYPPGSIFKIVTAAAALESGVDPNAKVRVDDPFQADPSWGDYFVRSASRAHADFSMADAFRLSENIYFAKVGLQVGGARLAEYAKRFGIGSVPKLDLAAAGGQLSNSGTLDRPTLRAATSFGQGELLVSPLQMALVAAAIANGGVQVAPHYAIEVRDAAGHVVRTVGSGPAAQVIRPETAGSLTQMLVGAVAGPGAFASGARISGVSVAGKTGTAENAAGAPHGWFVGFAPAEAPTVVVAVLIENARDGGVEAAPLGARVLSSALGR